ncbi:MAG: hypothetical protein PHQ95_02275 [Candidatus Gracilibacteria bacterium]|nr:hypothetical protein [Candidatus Gracilibacteria bacterium]
MKTFSKDSETEKIELLMDSEGLDENFIKSIGRLTLNFAHLEFCFALFTGSQLGTRQPLNQIIISELSFKQLLNISSGIYKAIETDKEKLAKFDQILKDAFYLEERRNTITHSFYGHNKEAEIIVRHKNTSKGKNGYREQVEIINAKSVNEIADQMNKTSIELGKMIFNLSK